MKALCRVLGDVRIDGVDRRTGEIITLPSDVAAALDEIAAVQIIKYLPAGAAAAAVEDSADVGDMPIKGGTTLIPVPSRGYERPGAEARAAAARRAAALESRRHDDAVRAFVLGVAPGSSLGLPLPN
jgi:hypothetical protein